MTESIDVRFPNGTLVEGFTAESAIRQAESIEFWRAENVKLKQSLSATKENVREYLDCLMMHVAEKHDPHIDRFAERIRGWCAPSGQQTTKKGE